jgi:hypothetical protein
LITLILDDEKMFNFLALSYGAEVIFGIAERDPLSRVRDAGSEDYQDESGEKYIGFHIVLRSNLDYKITLKHKIMVLDNQGGNLHVWDRNFIFWRLFLGESLTPISSHRQIKSMVA